MRKSSTDLFAIPEVTEVNRLPMHGAGIPYQSPEVAFSRNYSSSEFYIPLDGKWKFELYHAPEKIPAEVLTADYDDSAWRNIDVPSNWTLQNTFDKPVYTNVKMPFPNNPPFVPEENPSGIYRTTFTIPENWNSRRTILHIGGAESYIEVYLNGTFIGMGKDTRLPSEFELTPHLVSGCNSLICKVIRWSDSSYIEDQDQWWMAGIYRSVYLYSTKKVWLADVWANGDWEEKTQLGILDIHVQIAFDLPYWEEKLGPSEDYKICYHLFDKKKNKIAELNSEISWSFRLSGYTANMKTTVSNISPWSSESPDLYTLVTTLSDVAGNQLDCRSHRIGFRNIRIEGSNLLVNGKRVMIRGVNRHEHDPETGKTLSMERMLEDIRLLKQFNFNAVRTSHYPNDHRWYDLCDEYGIYLVDEANFEAHANYMTTCRNPRWKQAIISRAERMVLRDRSHASIISWSLGNESGNGENHTAAAEMVRKLDSTRFVFHEGELKCGWGQGSGDKQSGGPHEINAFYNPMYTKLSELKEFSNNPFSTRPAIMSEYAHAMGNSSGSLSDYWELFYSAKSIQGGFIWDWIDQGLLQYDQNGKPFYAYGGDFGEKIHDFNFCCNGMIAADRTPHPAMYEFRYLTQPVKVTSYGEPFGFCLKNRRDFTDLADLAGTWSVEVNGKTVRSGELTGIENIQPGETMDFTLPLNDLKRLENEEIFINFDFVLAENTAWANAGTLLAHEQIELTRHVPAEPVTVTEKINIKRSLKKSGNIWHLLCGDTGFVISEDGSVKELRQNEKTVLPEAFNPNFFRAGTDNDGVRGWTGQENKPLGKWLAAGLDQIKPELCSIFADAENFTLTCKYACKGTTDTLYFIQQITARQDGTFAFSQEYHIPESFPSMPRIGVLAMTAPGFGDFEYFGRGPWENYIDRCASAQVGLYRSTVRENFTSGYVIPQENGNRTGVRFLSLQSGDARIEITSDKHFEFGASHYTPHDLFGAFHPHELTERPETVLTLDLIQRGLGTGSCGPQTLEKYEINEKFYQFCFFIKISERKNDDTANDISL